MNRVQALARASRVFMVTGMTRDYVEPLVGQTDRLLHDVEAGDVQPMTTGGAPFSVPKGDEPLDYLLAMLLDAMPVHAFKSRQAWVLRFTALPHRRNQHLVGYPVPPAHLDSLEERMGMASRRESSPRPRTLEEAMAMRRSAVVELDDLSRRLGRTD